MKLLRTVLFCVATSCFTFPQSPPTPADIPPGVNYKPAADDVNSAAKILLEKALGGDKSAAKELLSGGPTTCGPLLWQVLKPGADAKLLASKPITMVLTAPVAVTTEGRGMVTDEAHRAFWEALLGKYPALATAKVRKANAREIQYYWATIPFDIEEPFFAVDTGSDVFVAHMKHDKDKAMLFWIDLVGDLRTLRPQQVSDPTMKTLVDKLSEQAERQTPEAMLRAGKAYLTGEGAAPDVEKGRKLLDGAAQNGVLEAQMLLGMAYFSGKYLPQDRAKAAPYLQMAAAQGNAIAQYYVGMMYLYGTGLEKSAEKAMPFLQKAADQNIAGAQYNLGAMYFQGVGTATDKARACALYAKAAEQADLQAINDLGWCYQLGEGVEKDLTKAMTLYAKAAEAGHPRSQGNLAMLYRANGEWEKAYMWLRIAEIAGGGAQARPVIDDLKKHMTPAQIDSAEVKVLEWQKTHPRKQ